jgi:RNA polymerase II subunit A C-terminal domain phosphatase
MLLRLPPTLHYPITVLSLLKRPGDKIKRDEAIFSYIYYTVVSEGDGLGNRVSVRREYPSKFQSTADGELMLWRVSNGDVINGP